MRQLATVQKISEVCPIENADAIEKVRVLDWWCVAKKGEFSAGDDCVYFEIDSLLPASHPAFAFLAARSHEVSVATDTGEARGYRLRTIRLRGQISQGLALPLQTFALNAAVGEDLSEALGVHKWEPPIPANMAAAARAPFPYFIPKTDEERVQNIGDVVRRHAGEPFHVTEKLDGCSVTFYRTADRFGVCGRNWDLLDGDNLYWNMARIAQVEANLPVGYAIQGELIGEHIQGNPLKLKGQRLFCFNVFSFSSNADSRYLNHDDAVAFCERLGLSWVPVVHRGYTLPHLDIAELIEMADGKSALNQNADREGLVFRPLVEAREEMRGGMCRLSFKAISNRYLLKGD